MITITERPRRAPASCFRAPVAQKYKLHYPRLCNVNASVTLSRFTVPRCSGVPVFQCACMYVRAYECACARICGCAGVCVARGLAQGRRPPPPRRAAARRRRARRVWSRRPRAGARRDCRSYRQYAGSKAIVPLLFPAASPQPHPHSRIPTAASYPCKPHPIVVPLWPHPHN